MNNQSAVHAVVRAATGTALDYNGDWSALFDQAGIAVGDWNGRMLAWLNLKLGITYPDLPGAMQAYAVTQGYDNWTGMGGGFSTADLVVDGAGEYVLDETLVYVVNS